MNSEIQAEMSSHVRPVLQRQHECTRTDLESRDEGSDWCWTRSMVVIVSPSIVCFDLRGAAPAEEHDTRGTGDPRTRPCR